MAIAATATPVTALQLFYSSPGNVSKIEDFIVDGITYDVTFKNDTFFNIFGNPNNTDFLKPTFWDNQNLAKTAVNNLVPLLNNQKPVPTQVNNSPSVLFPYRGVVASNGNLFLVSKVSSYITQWNDFQGESQDIFTQGNTIANYAIFTPKTATKTIPEPQVSAGILGTVFIIAANRFKRKVRE
ncbi:hypothetical protein IJ00_24125 [Calothrix sp. 336/3]|nr:hypothetical protein IJ00_24125 [Calothrix sp. 336/3]